MYWSLVFAIAAFGSALIVALILAAAIVLGPWFALREARRSRSPVVRPVRSAWVGGVPGIGGVAGIGGVPKGGAPA